MDMVPNPYAKVSHPFSSTIHHYYSPGSQTSPLRPIGRSRAGEIQPSLLPLQVTGTYHFMSHFDQYLIFVLF
jgi:hypothetical protein